MPKPKAKAKAKAKPKPIPDLEQPEHVVRERTAGREG